MEFRILGPLEVLQGDGLVRLGGPKQRAVLARLLVNPNRVVSTDQLIDELWGERPPEEARNALQSYISRLRGVLGPDRIEGRPPGYTLHADPDEIDAVRFEELLRDALTLLEFDPEAARVKLEQALGLWRGPALAGVTAGPTIQAEVTRLEELRLDAEEGRVAAYLERGSHREVIDDLEALTRQYPFRESLWGYLMTGLYRGGRQAEALAAYRRLRDTLAEGLGIDPSPELQRIELRILQQDPSLEVATRRLRGYRLEEEIGAGYFGVVFRARQPHVERDVAVKVIRPIFADRTEFIRRFEAEAQVVARLEHPHIVPLYDYWRDPGGAHLVMRLMRGGSVRGLIAGRGPVGLVEAVRIIDQVASGLDAAHRSGVIHRDLKPANLLLDEDGRVYLSDFGIAVDSFGLGDIPEDITTYGYLSPEQIRTEPATPRTDVYALGVLLYELLTGRHPFADPSPKGLLQRHIEEAIPPIGSAQLELPPGLDELIQRAAAKDSAERYESPVALAADLRNLLDRGSEPVSTVVPLRNPYRGLRAFEEADAPYFFGRGSLVERLIDRMEDTGPGSRFLAVVGPSGSGKSSVVRAGLIPALRLGAIPGSDRWLVAQVSPGPHPLDELETALSPLALRHPSGLAEETRKHPDRLPGLIAQILPDDAELLLVIDQFEELFTLVDDESHRAAFLDAVLAAVQDAGTRIRVVVTLRADYYDRPLLYQRFGRMLADRTVTVTPLSPEELERVIVGPAEKVGVAVEPLLVGGVVKEVADQPGALPLLQYALTETFERREDSQLSWTVYQAVGGVSRALARRAEEIFQGLDISGREACRQLFLRLVSADEHTEDARRRVPHREISSLEVDQRSLQHVIDSFGEHRLLSFDRDPRSRAPTVEVAHEALLREWGRLRGWLDAAEADVRLRRSLGAIAAEWEESGRDPSFLLRGARLEQFDSWTQGSGLSLALPERQYLEASLHAEAVEEAERTDREIREAALERRSIRRLRSLVGVLLAGVVATIGISVFALSQREQAQQEARTSAARELASAALANLDVDPDLAILLALRAVETTRGADGTVLTEAEEALHTALQASRVVLRLPDSRDVAYSSDGRLIAAAPSSGVALHDAQTGRVVLRLDAEGPAHLALSPVTPMLAVAGRGPVVSLYDTTSGERLHTLVSESGAVEPVTFSPDGRFLAGLTLEGTAIVWDTETGDEVARVAAGGGSGLDFSPDSRVLAVPVGSETALYGIPSGEELGRVPGDGRNVSFSPDGALLATTGLNGLASIWDLSTNQRLFLLVGHEGHVNAVTFSSDGRFIATGGHDGTARIWDVTTGEQVLEISGQASVEYLAFSPDGRFLASGGSTGALVWDVTEIASRESWTVAAHRGTVFNVTYSPDGSQIATAGEDGSATIWDAETGDRVVDLVSHQGGVTDVVYRPDGTMLATSSFDGTAKLWDPSGEEIRTLVGHTAPVWAVAFSPDGSRLVTASEDGTGRVWDVATGETLVVFRGHTDFVYDATWSPDGSVVVSVSNDFTARAWDPATGEELVTFQGHDENVVEQAFSPDGTRVATVGFDGVARVWDVSTGEQKLVLEGHGGIVLDVEATPDGKRWVTASLDGSIRFWDAVTGREVLALSRQSPPVGRLAISPDGKRLSGGTVSGLLKVYVLDIEELIEIARNRVSRPLTDAECSQYLHTQGCIEGSTSVP